MKLPVVITLGQDGYYVAETPVLPGCISQGKTREEAMLNIAGLPVISLNPPSN